MVLLDVLEAAKELAVSPRRVRQLLASGQLPGQRLGRSWAIDRTDLQQLRRRGVGRPWSAASAWAVLDLAGGGEPDLSPVERSRARKRLAENGLAGLVVPLRSRADRRDLYAHPSALDRIVEDERVVRGGVSGAREHEIDLIVQDAAEMYVSAGQMAALVHRYALHEDADRANVIVRAVGDEVWPFDEESRVAPWPVVAVDLVDWHDERSHRAGLELIERHH